MVTLLSFQQDDFFWDREIDFHIYEKAYKAATPAPGSFRIFGGLSDGYQESVQYRFGIAAAKVKDRARKALIRAAHKAEMDTFPIKLGEQPKRRTIDGLEAQTPDSIKL